MKKAKTIGFMTLALAMGAACQETSSGSGTLQDAGSLPDRGTTPVMYLRVGGNFYSNRKTMERVSITLGPRYLVSPQAAEKLLKSAVSVIALPGKTPVAGKLDIHLDWKTAIFFPAAPFKKDVTHAVWIKKIGPLVPSDEYSVFRLGPLPWVQGLSFIQSKADPSVLEEVIVTFSEAVTTAKAYAAISVTDAAAKSAHKTTHASPTAENSAVTLTMPAGVKRSDKVRITVGTDVGAVSGVKLDGEYTLTTAGSGPFSIELVPANLSNQSWKPVANL